MPQTARRSGVLYPEMRDLFHALAHGYVTRNRQTIQFLVNRLSAELGVKPSMVDNWRQGKSKPSQYSAIRLLGVCGIQEADLDRGWLGRFLAFFELPANSVLGVELSHMLDGKVRTALKLKHRLAPYMQDLGDGQQALCLNIDHDGDIDQALAALGLEEGRPVMVLVGGASYLNAVDANKVERLFKDVIAPLCEEHRVTVVDGGTQSGVIRLIGEARAAAGFTFPLVGVVPKGAVQYANVGQVHNTSPLEPNHTQFFLVPGQTFSEESPWIAHIAQRISAGRPSFTLVANGGAVTWKDIMFSFAVGRPVLALEGTGRAADEFSQALRTPGADPRTNAFRHEHFARSVHISNPELVRHVVNEYLVHVRR
jgi:hypothetical protein